MVVLARRVSHDDVREVPITIRLDEVAQGELLEAAGRHRKVVVDPDRPGVEGQYRVQRFERVPILWRLRENHQALAQRRASRRGDHEAGRRDLHSSRHRYQVLKLFLEARVRRIGGGPIQAEKLSEERPVKVRDVVRMPAQSVHARICLPHLQLALPRSRGTLRVSVHTQCDLAGRRSGLFHGLCLFEGRSMLRIGTFQLSPMGAARPQGQPLPKPDAPVVVLDGRLAIAPEAGSRERPEVDEELVQSALLHRGAIPTLSRQTRELPHRVFPTVPQLAPTLVQRRALRSLQAEAPHIQGVAGAIRPLREQQLHGQRPNATWCRRASSSDRRSR
mmetsp:Transcript_82879/g.268594  ORF Transcript_82879/g.268594 Transcript_82879/m.268594 type:complete len:333 (+) Transcript_82879:896-1894(+)